MNVNPERLTSDTHDHVVEGVGETVARHCVHHGRVAHSHALAQVQGVRRLAHGLLAATDDNARVPASNGLIGESARAEARTAQHVDGCGGDGL